MKYLPVSLVVLFAGLKPLAGAVLPYSNDFGGTGSNTALTEFTDAQWALSNGAYRNTFTSTTVAASVASVAITDLAGRAFEMETQFTVVSTGGLNNNGQMVGFGFLGASPGFGGTNASSAFYLADFQYAHTTGPGTLRILAVPNVANDPDMTRVDAVVDANATSSTLAVELNTTYTLRLTGSYSGSVLNMSLGLFNAAGTTQIGASATASDKTPLTGTHFGFRNRFGLSGGSASIDLDNLSITAIPEPSSALPLGFLALLGSLAMRRKPTRRRALASLSQNE